MRRAEIRKFSVRLHPVEGLRAVNERVAHSRCNVSLGDGSLIKNGYDYVRQRKLFVYTATSFQENNLPRNICTRYHREHYADV